MIEDKILLKDSLFSEEKIAYLSNLLANAYFNFDEPSFQRDVLKKFPKLELKERIFWMSTCMEKYLPSDYDASLHILLQTLPEELDTDKTDDDFGDFILAPIGHFVVRNGLNRKSLKSSLEALGEMTKRFSVEDSIRYFINSFPEETMLKMEEWSRSDNYHQRRLASEGLRPKLPWSIGLKDFEYKDAVSILDNLFYDKTRYVTRSVANHLNDISKIDPELVIKTLDKWQNTKKQNAKEMDFIIQHSLRTLVKKGDQNALNFLGYQSSPTIEITNLKIHKSKIAFEP